MARPLRIEFPGAIYYVMARGNGRRDIVRGDGDRERLNNGLEATVGRYAWGLFSYLLI